MSLFCPPLQVPTPIKPLVMQLRPADNRLTRSEDPSDKTYPLMAFSCEPMDELRTILFAPTANTTTTTAKTTTTSSMGKQTRRPPLNLSIRASVDGFPVPSAYPTTTFLDTTTLADSMGGVADDDDEDLRDDDDDDGEEDEEQQLEQQQQQQEEEEEPSCLECSGEAPCAMFEFELPQMPAASPTPLSSSMGFGGASDFPSLPLPERCDNPIARNEGFMEFRAVIPGRPCQEPNKGPSDDSSAELNLLGLSPPEHQMRAMHL